MIKDKKKLLQAKVISNKMLKTIVAKIERLIKHQIYKKYVKKSMKIHVHDEYNEAKPGDTITISECRPLSKTKSWILVNIMNREKYIKKIKN